MNDSTPQRPHGRMPSDAEIDDLLREFFRLETPAELNQSFQLTSGGVSVRPSLVRNQEEIAASRTRPWNRRYTVAGALTVAALSLAIFLQTRDGEPAAGSSLKNTISEQNLLLPAAEKLMLVSPQGDSGAQQSTVGDDGVTLEETDNIEVKQRR